MGQSRKKTEEEEEEEEEIFCCLTTYSQRREGKGRNEKGAVSVKLVEEEKFVRRYPLLTTDCEKLSMEMEKVENFYIRPCDDEIRPRGTCCNGQSREAGAGEKKSRFLIYDRGSKTLLGGCGGLFDVVVVVDFIANLLLMRETLSS